MLKRRSLNPWSWQDAFQFVQANELVGVGRVLLCSGQASLDEQARPLHVGDMRGQLEQAFDNLERVLAEGGMELGDVVRLTCYATDIPAYRQASDVLRGRLARAGCKTAFTLLGVTSLAYPELLVELEATAVRE
jgi:enamine deaminase RidA (YjgF/YER057c/UK114 family)